MFGCIALRKLQWAVGEAVKEAALLYHSYHADADADADAGKNAADEDFIRIFPSTDEKASMATLSLPPFLTRMECDVV